MKATPLTTSGLTLIQPKVFGAVRCVFFESFNQKKFEAVIAIQWPFDGAPAPSAKERQGKLLAPAERFA